MIEQLSALSSPTIAGILAALAVTLAVAGRRKALTSARPFFRGSLTAETKNAAEAIRTQLQADGLAKLERLRARAARLEQAVRVAAEQLRRATAKLETALGEEKENRVLASNDPKPVVSVRTAKIMKVLAIAGDNFVVAAVIMEREASTPPLLAATIALAISIALVMLGWHIGLGLRDHARRSGRMIAGSALLLASFSLALFGLREEFEAAWIALAIAPAVATAAIALIGPSVNQQEVARDAKRVIKQERKVRKAEKKHERLQGRHDGLLSRIETRIQVIALTTKAEARRTGLADLVENWNDAGAEAGLTDGPKATPVDSDTKTTQLDGTSTDDLRFQPGLPAPVNADLDIDLAILEKIANGEVASDDLELSTEPLPETELAAEDAN